MLPLSDSAAFYKAIRRNNLDSITVQLGSLASTGQYRLVYQKAAQYIPPSARCLDWGSGSGHFSYFLLQNGIYTEGYSFEACPGFLSHVARYHHTQGRPTDPVGLPYPDRTFDQVFSIGVLEHVHETGGNQHRSLLEIQRILKPGGLFLIFHLPNRYTWIEYLVRIFNRLTVSNKHAHTKLFSRTSFLALLEGTSFEVLEARRYNFIPRNTLNRLPQALTNSALFCRLVNAADDALAWTCPALCQNWYFVLRKQK